MKIKNIAIIGGGTAGWLAGNHLGRELMGDPEIAITVIESPDVPIIGVGEGTVPSIRNSLQNFGISEAEFISACDVTFKQGIKFIEWLDPKTHGTGHYYYHPFDIPYPFGMDTIPAWLTQHSRPSFAHAVSAQAKICDAMLAPKSIHAPEYQGEANYAYHLNAMKFSQLLAKNAKARFGVQHQLATIVGATRRDDGNIAALVTNGGEHLAFDFYIDCSGFASILLTEELQVPFVDKSCELLTNTALAMQVPTELDSVIPPYTLATAHKAGWIWDIALTNRRGTGFVYSSEHMSESEALQQFSQYLGVDAEQFSPRKIPMKVGYRQEFWHKNCVAIGLAQGFVEPLEATSILVTDFAAQYLARNFPQTNADVPLLSKRYNQVMIYSWERVIDFVKLHYCLSDRSDSDFWILNRSPETMSDTLQERLAIWKNFYPRNLDFFSKFEIFDAENYLYVLYGMKYPTAGSKLLPAYLAQCEEITAELRQHTAQLCKSLPNHRALLQKLVRA